MAAAAEIARTAQVGNSEVANSQVWRSLRLRQSGHHRTGGKAQAPGCAAQSSQRTQACETIALDIRPDA